MRLLALLVLAAGCSSSGDSGAARSGSGSAGSAAADGAAAAIDAGAQVSYPATDAGLESLIDDLVAARAAGDEDRAYQLTASLRLDGYEAWFADQFGDALGARLASDYERQRADIGLMVRTVSELRENGRTETQIEKFDSAADQKAVGYQSKALAKMKRKVPLFSVRLHAPGDERSFHIWSFIHLGGTFRYVGKMKAVGDAEKLGDLDLQEFRLVDAVRLRQSRAKTDAGATP